MSTTPDPFAAIEQHHIPIEPVLQRVLERFASDAGFREDLDRCGFQPCPMPADEIDCLSPWFFVIAMNGGGSAYGLYVHPEVVRDGVAPWVYWEHEDDSLLFLAEDSDRFFRGFLAGIAEYNPEEHARLRAVLAELGVSIDGEPVELPMHAPAPNAHWLPPAEDQLRDVEHYLALDRADPAAERGLLAHWSLRQDRNALQALEALWAERSWTPPRFDP